MKMIHLPNPISRPVRGRIAASIVLATILAAASHTNAAPVTDNVQLWLDATDAATVLDLSGDPAGTGGFDGTVQTWLDKSGNDNDATSQTTQRPVYNATPSPSLNGQPVITFATGGGETRAFALDDLISLPQETMFFVTRVFDSNSNGGWVGPTVGVGGPGGFVNDTENYYVQAGGTFTSSANSAPTTFQVLTETRAPSTGSWAVYEDGASVAGNATPGTMSVQSVGAYAYGAPTRYFKGEMAEVIIYNQTLNTAERVITENYLASKYGTTLPSTDKYAGDTLVNGNYDFDVFGIGRDAASTVSPAGALSASSGDALSLTELNLSLANGEYVLAGHDTTAHGITTSDLPLLSLNGMMVSRWSRDYYLDFTGTLDAELAFDFAVAGLGNPEGFGYSLLYRATPTGSFTDTGIMGSISGSTVSFNLLGFDNTDDGFYTLAAVVPEPSTVLLLIAGGGLLWRRRRRHQTR